MPLPSTIAGNLFSTGALAPTGTPVAAPAALPGAGGAAGGSRFLAFPRQGQVESNWCWSACGVATDHFFTSTSTLTQCQLASQELGSVCCPAGSNSACNIPWYLHTTLTRVGHYAGFKTGAATFLTELISQIDSNRPVGVRIEWAGSGGLAHFVMISGYDNVNGVEQVVIEDPAPVGVGSQVTLDYATFITSYLGTGFVTHTFWLV